MQRLRRLRLLRIQHTQIGDDDLVRIGEGGEEGLWPYVETKTILLDGAPARV